MKRTLFFALSILAVQASAQPLSPARFPAAPAPRHPLVSEILRQQTAQTAAKGAGVQERLIARSNHYYVSSVDSIYFTYSGGRGSALSNDDLYGTYFGDLYTPMYSYPSRRTLPSLMYDTANGYTDASSIFVTRQYAGNTMTQFFDTQALWGNKPTRQEYIYNSDGQLMTGREYQDTAAVPTGNYTFIRSISCRYGPDGVMQDTGYAPQPVILPYFSTAYTYNTAGLLAEVLTATYINGALQNQTRHHLFYDAANRLAAHIQEYDTGTGFMRQHVDSFQYTGANLTREASYEWYTNGAPAYATSQLHQYNAAGNKDTTYLYNLSTGTPKLSGMMAYTYTAANHFERITLRAHNDTAYIGTPSAYYFYYESYTPTAVAPVIRAAEMGSLYPVPAHDVLHLRLKQQGAAGVRIFNTAGQLLREVSNAATAGYEIPIGELSAGSYMAEISQGAERQCLPFVKE